MAAKGLPGHTAKSAQVQAPLRLVPGASSVARWLTTSALACGSACAPCSGHTRCRLSPVHMGATRAQLQGAHSPGFAFSSRSTRPATAWPPLNTGLRAWASTIQ